MEIKTEDYRTYYDAETETVFLQGVLRLRGAEDYTSIVQLLYDVSDRHPPVLTLDLQELQLLNSSGIGVLSKFVIRIRKQGTTKLVIHASKTIPWQEQSLKNFQRLLPSLKLEFD